MEENIELIIIDNDPRPMKFSSDNIKKLDQTTNIFVNPAWNLGVQEAKYDHIVILNDDITCNLKCFYKNYVEFVKQDLNLGVISFDISPFVELTPDNPLNNDDDVLTPKVNTVRTHGFGMFMAMPKENYPILPEGLTVFYGDDLINVFNIRNGRTNYTCPELQFKGEFSVSSKEFGYLLQDQDQLKIYNETINTYGDKS